MKSRAKRFLAAVTGLSLVGQVLVVVGLASLITVADPNPPAAEAHSVAQVDLASFMSPDTVSMLASRGTGIQTGDVLEWIVSFTPVDNGSLDGPGGYVTFYVPDGLEVVGAAVVEPTGSGYVEVPIGSPGGIPGGAGGTNHPWPAPFDAGDPYDGGEWEIGTLPQVYGDTGIFFSTDPRTSKYVETTWMDGADPDIVSATVDNGYRIEPSACGQLTGFVGATECRTHNLWDAEMTNWFGSGGGTVPPVNPGDEPAGSEPHVAPRGRTPYLVGSAVAGPDTFYGYDYTGSTGPWERIQYPGSTIGFGPPNDLAIPDYAYTSVTPGVNDGRVLNESNPLPAGTNAIRWSVGELIVGDINFVKVSLRVLPAFDPAICHAADAEVFGGDAGLDGGGKDSAWRYNEPAPAPGQTCMALSKTGPAVASTGGTASYTITLANVTAFPADNVVLTDLLDPGMGYVSASPVPDTVAGQNLTWNIGTLLAGEARTFTVDVDSLSGDVLLNTVTATSDDTPPAEARTSTYLGSLVDMSMSKTVAPDTQARNGTVTYTVTLTNDGNATALGVDLSDTLATGFTYVPGSTLVNGVSSSDPIGSGSGPLDWALGDLAAGSSWVVSFDALVGATVPLDAYYYNNFTTTWDETALPTTQSKTLLNQAPVYVAPPADLGVVKTDSADPVLPGIPLSYTLTVTNYGTEDATNVAVTDTLPSLFVYASATPDQGSCSYSAPTLTCDLGGLPNGASTDIVIDGSVSPTAVAGQLLQNVASVDGDQADSDPTNNLVVEPTFVTGPGGSCRAVADTGGANGGDDLLTIIDHTDSDPATNEVSIGTGTGTSAIEANAANTFTGTLYGIDAGQLGIIDTTTGVFDATGLFPVGSGDGADGPQAFSDIDGLTFDPYAGYLWGAVRRDADLDLLIKIDPDTGRHIPDAFGPGVDYLEIAASGSNADIDSLAFDVETGRLYGAANSGANNADLVIIDVTDGSVTTVGLTGIFDLEGMSVDEDGQMWATDGTSLYYLYQIDKWTAASSNPVQIDNGGDYESVECRSAFGSNTISGTVFYDADASATYNFGDTPLPGITVTIYRDSNNDGVVDAGDWPLTTIETDGSGFYEFDFAADGNFVIDIDPAALPSGWVYTTPDVNEADFVGYGNTDAGNDFGGTFPPTLDVDKVASPAGVVFPGDTIEYTITVTNSGTGPATNVVVSDPEPAGSTWQPAPGTVITTPTTTSGSFRDEFNSVSYVENDGDVGFDWKAGWEEIGETTDPTANDTRVLQDGAYPTYALYMKKIDKGVWRSADLSSFVEGELTMRIRRQKVKNANLTVYVGPSATGPWTTAIALPGTGTEITDTDYIDYSYSFTAPALFTSDFTVRMVMTGDSDEFYVDDVDLAVYERSLKVFAGDAPAILAPPATPPAEMGGQSELDLLPGESMVVTFEVVVDDPALETSIDNVVAVTSDQQPVPITDSTSNPLGAPGVGIEKKTNGIDADAAPGPIVEVGSTVTWTYEVSNTGGVDLTSPAVIDDMGTPGVPGDDVTLSGAPDSGDDGDGILEPGETWVYSQTGTATAGQYVNTAQATATPPAGPDVTDTDPSHYLGSDPAIVIEKSTNGADADAPTGPFVTVGSLVSWTYAVTNPGNVELSFVSVTDDNGTPGNLTDDFAPTFGGGDTDSDGKLDPGETWTYSAVGTADPGQYGNVATATGTPPVGSDVTDDDLSHYFGSAPAIAITKSITDVGGDGPAGVVDAAGDVVSYSITTSNTGNITLTNVSVSDPLLGGLSCDALTSLGNAFTNGTGSLVVGDSVDCSGTYTATQADIDGDGGGDGDIDNTASATSTEAGPVTDSAAVPIGAGPRVGIVKSVSDVGGEGALGSVDAAGDVVSYSIVVSNTGNVTLSNVTVSDPLLVVLSCDATSAFGNPFVNGTGTLVVGDSVTCTGSYTASQADLDTNGGGDGDIDNTASVVASEAGPETDSVEAPVDVAPNFSITKSITDVGGDGPAGSIDAAGDVVSYSIVVANTGNQTLTGVGVADPLLADLDCDAGTPGFQTSGFTLAVGDSLTCTGTYTATQVDLDTNGGGDGDIDNTATGSTDQVADKVDAAEAPVDEAPNFSIIKSITDVGGDGPGGLVEAAGDVISYQIVVTNTGNQTLTGVAVADPLLADLDCDAVAPGFQTSGFTLTIGGSVTCTGTYAATQVDLDTNGGGDGDIDNTATGSTDQVADKVDAAEAPVNVDPNFSVAKSITDVGGDGPAGSVDAAGDVISYQIVVTNTGNRTLTNVTVSDPLLADLDCDLVTPGFQTSGFTLTVGDSLTCVGTYTAVQADIDTNGGGDGDIDNTATATSNEAGPHSDSAAAPITAAPDFSITKSVTDVGGDGPTGSVDAAGDAVSYQIVLANTGNQTLTIVSVADPLVADLDCDPVTPGLQTSVLTLNVGGSLTCTGTYTATQTDLDTNGAGDGDIDNTATGSTAEVADKTDAAEAPVDTAPNFSITKSITDVGGDGPTGSVDAAGDVVSYSIVVTNTGNQTLTGVAVADPLLTDLDCDAVTPGFQTSGFTLADAASLTCTGTYTATQVDLDTNGGGDGDIDNTATGSTDQVADKTDSAAAPIGVGAGIAITKSITDVGGDGPAGSVDAAGDVISYSITVSNTGNVTLTNVTVSDPLLVALACDATTAFGNPFANGTGSLVVGDSVSCTGSYTATQGDIDTDGGGDGDIDNTATVTSVEAGPESDTAEAPVDVTPNFSISKSITDVGGDGPTGSVDAAGDIVSYSIVLSNTGNQTLTIVSVADPLVADLDCDPVTPGFQTSVLTLNVAGTLTCTGTYTATQTEIDTNGGGDGDIDNTATGSTAEVADKADSVEAPVDVAPNFSITKSITDVAGAGPTGSVNAAGDVISYQIVLANTGNQTLTGVSVADPLVADLDCDAVTPGPQTSGFTLSVGASLTCIGTYTAIQADIDTSGGGDGDIDNTATGSTDQVADKTDSAEAPISVGPRAAIAKSITDVGGDGPAGSVDAAGDVISYSIVVTNPGNVTLTSVAVADSLVSDLDCDAVTPGPQTSGFTLNVGASLTCTGTYTATQTDIDTNGGGDGDIDNTATTTSTEAGPESDSAEAPVDVAPNFSIAKSVTDVGGDGPAGSVDEAGDVVSYSIVVTNTGNQTLTGVAVADPLLTDLDCDAVTPGTQTSGFTVAVGGSLTCTGTYAAIQADIDTNGGGDGDIDNIATGSTDQVADKSDSAEAPISVDPRISIAKSVTDVGGDGPAGSVDEAGDVVSYSIVVANTGNQTLTSVAVADPLLTDLDCDAVTPGLQTSGFTLAVGGSLTCTGTYTAIQADIDTNGGGDSDIDNTATATSVEAGPVSDSVAVPINTDPHLAIVKSITDVGGDGPTGAVDAAGDVVSYSIVVSNTGNQTLTSVATSDPLLADLDCDAVTPGFQTSGFTVAVGGSLTCTGTYTAVQADIDTNGGGDGDIDNTASAVSTEAGPETDSAEAPVNAAPNFSVTKSITDVGGDGPAGAVEAAGDVVSYQIVLANTGNQTLTIVSVADPLLADLDCDAVTPGLQTSGFTLSVGASLTCTGTYTATQADIDSDGGGDGDIDNTATGSTAEVADKTDSAAAPIGAGPRVGIVKSISDVGGEGALGSVDAAGDVVSYSIVVSNTGNVTLSNVTVSDPLLVVLSCDATSAFGNPFVNGTGTLVVGDSVECTGSYTASQADLDTNGGGDGDIDNTASVVASEAGPETDSVEAPVDVAPNFSITKSITDVGGDGPAGSIDAAGDVVSYSIVVANTGNQTLTGVGVADPLLADLDCDAVAPGFQTSGFTLAVGDSLTCTGTYTATQVDLDTNGGGDGDIDNTATGSTDQVADKVDAAEAPVDEAPNFSIVKSITDVGGDGPGGLVEAAGDVISYQIVVTNTGNQTLTSVAVADPLLADLDCDAVTPGFQTSGFTLTIGGSVTCTGTYAATQVDLDTNGGGDGDIDNTATGSTDQVADKVDAAEAPVNVDPNFSVAKSITDVGGDGPTGSVDAAGDVISYQIVVTNTGNRTLTNVTVSDPLLADLDCDLVTPGFQTSGFTLTVGDSLTCVGTYTAVQADIDTDGGGDGDIDNTATATSNEAGPHSDSAAAPIGAGAGIAIAKSVTDVGGDGPAGSVDAAGDVISYSIVVTNTGNQTLTNVTVSDPLLSDLDCDLVTPGLQTSGFTLAIGASLTCTGTYTATQTDIDTNGAGDGDIDNTATATSTEAGPVTDSAEAPIDQAPAIGVEKATNGQDADAAPGPLVGVGGSVTWVYTVTNLGNVALSTPAVTDNNGTPTDPTDDLTGSYVSGDTDGDTLLDVGETWTFDASGTAIAGQYSNLAVATGTPPVGSPVSDDDPSHYFGSDPVIVIEKATNGDDADVPTGPIVEAGSTVTWTYEVTNPGNVELSGVVVIDDNGTPGDATDDFSPAFIGGDTDFDGDLDPGEIWTYEASGTATTGQHGSIAVAEAASPIGQDVTDDDPSHHFGSDPAIVIENATNGSDADTPTGPVVEAGSLVTWTYVVTNPGNIELSGIAVVDDNGTPGDLTDDFAPSFVGGDTDGDSKLDPGETWTYQATNTASAGQYGNTADVTGTPPVGSPVTDDDPSHYFGSAPAIVIEKATNGDDADVPTGPIVEAGSTVTWTYEVTNPGNVELSGVVVIDDNGTPGDATDDFSPVFIGGDTDLDGDLDPGEIWTYEASGTAITGQHGSIAVAEAASPIGQDVTDDDPSHHFGSDPAIVIENATNGSDADTPTGPVVEAGSLVTWTYVVTNPGNIELSGIAVVDDNGTPGDLTDDFAPSFVGGDTDGDSNLDPGETWTYQATNTASAGQYGNTADVTGTPPVGSPVTDDDPSHYLGVTAALSGRIWLDEDRDGIEQPGDAGVESITVTLYAASDLTTPVATTTSAPDGTYVFTDLPAGDYVVGIDIPGDMMSSPANVGGDDSADSDLDPGTHLTASVSVPTGGLVADVDAGVYPVPVSVGDLVWYDVDGNGLHDGVDMPLAGVSVELVSGDVVLDTQVTAADGTFLWTDLAPGAYEVRVVSDSLPAGIELNTYDTDGILDGAYSEDVPPGGHLASEFAYAGVGLIGDTVWYDADGDGTQNMMSNGTMEPGLESIVLSAVWVGFDGVAGTADDMDFGARVSNEDGKYLFSQLPFGDFIVDVGDANGYLHAGETTLTVTVDAAVLGNALTADFRFVLPEPELPRTGAETRDLTLVALALIGLGLLFVGVGRRREDDPEPV